MALTDKELMLLSSFMYLQDSVVLKDDDFRKVGDIVNYYLDNQNKLNSDTLSGGYETKDGIKNFLMELEDIKENHPHIMNMGLGEVTNPNKDRLVRGRCFIEYDEAGNEAGQVVAFRGTGGTRVAWLDDFQGLYMKETAAQREAKEFVADLEYENLTVTGHSKGGNLAMYVTSNEKTAGKVQRCVSFDGQGFNLTYIKSIPEREMEGAGKKIKSVSTYNDPINGLLTSIAGENLYFNNKYNGAISKTHSLHSLYASNYSVLEENDGMFNQENAISQDKVLKEVLDSINKGVYKLPYVAQKIIADTMGNLVGIGIEASVKRNRKKEESEKSGKGEGIFDSHKKIVLQKGIDGEIKVLDNMQNEKISLNDVEKIILRRDVNGGFSVVEDISEMTKLQETMQEKGNCIPQLLQERDR